MTTEVPEYVQWRDRTLHEIECDVLLNVLSQTGWNKRRTSQILGVTEQTIHNKIKKLPFRRERPQ